MVSSRKILLTTSRDPTPRIRTFCKDLMRAIPSVVSVNRGKMSVDEVAEKALEHDADHVAIVDRWHGGPSALKFFRVGQSGLVLTSPVIHVAGIRLQREFGVPKVKPAHSMVLLESENSGEMLRLMETFSSFFSVPILSMDEAAKAGPTLMCFSRDKARGIVITFMVEPGHVEVGPRISVSRVEW